MSATPSNILALDVGTVRIGVALADGVARIARPFITLDATGDVIRQIHQIIQSEDIGVLVVGLPRGLDGQETAQTMSVRTLAATLESLQLPLYLQDEALTSRKAKAELESRGKPYAKGDIDALAATYILDDWLAEQPKGSE